MLQKQCPRDNFERAAALLGGGGGWHAALYLLFSSAAGGTYWPIAIRCPSLPFP